MFYVALIAEVIQVEPKFIGRDFKEMVRKKLNDMTESKRDTPKLMGELGYLIKVPRVLDDDICSGVIAYESGFVNVHVKYKAIMCRPFKNERLSTKVTSVFDSHIIAFVGPIEIIVHGINEELWIWDEENRLWRSSEAEDIVIEEGSKLRVKITAVNLESNVMRVNASMDEDFLGPHG